MQNAQITLDNVRVPEDNRRARGNGILLENQVGRFVADAEAIYSYEGTREINTLLRRPGPGLAATFPTMTAALRR